MPRKEHEAVCCDCGATFVTKASVRCPECRTKHRQKIIANTWAERQEKVERFEKTCAYCGKRFLTINKNQLCCSQPCATARHNKLTHEARKMRAREQREEAKNTDFRKLEAKNGFKSLAQVEAEARAMGMSYGQYSVWIKTTRRT